MTLGKKATWSSVFSVAWQPKVLKIVNMLGQTVAWVVLNLQ